MDIEKSAEALTGMELDQAVVRVKYPEGECVAVPSTQLNSPRFHVRSVPWLTCFHLGMGHTADEAWAEAADKVIEAAGYEVSQPSSSGIWYFLNGDEDCTYPGAKIRALALESAKRDYVQRNTLPEAPKATEEPVQSDEEWVWQHFPNFYIVVNQKGDHFAGFRTARYEVGAMRADGYGTTRAEMFSEARETLESVVASRLTSSASAKSEPYVESPTLHIGQEYGAECCNALSGHHPNCPMLAIAKSEEQSEAPLALIRDAILNNRYECEEGVLDGDQTNAVLAVIDRFSCAPAVPAQGDGELLVQQQWIDEALRAAGMNVASQNFEHRFYKLASFALAERIAAQERIRELEVRAALRTYAAAKGDAI